MTQSRKPDDGGDKVGGEAPVTPPTGETKPASKTLQELERIQFDALDRLSERTGFDGR